MNHWHWFWFVWWTGAALHCVYVIGDSIIKWRGTVDYTKEQLERLEEEDFDLQISPAQANIAVFWVVMFDAVFVSAAWPIMIPVMRHFMKKWENEMEEEE